MRHRGTVAQKSRNLAGIRRYVAKHATEIVMITPTETGGTLSILFADKEWFATDFADYGVLKDFVRRWRNVYGTELSVDGELHGPVSYDNPALAPVDTEASEEADYYDELNRGYAMDR